MPFNSIMLCSPVEVGETLEIENISMVPPDKTFRDKHTTGKGLMEMCVVLTRPLFIKLSTLLGHCGIQKKD